MRCFRGNTGDLRIFSEAFKRFPECARASQEHYGVPGISRSFLSRSKGVPGAFQGASRLFKEIFKGFHECSKAEDFNGVAGLSGMIYPRKRIRLNNSFLSCSLLKSSFFHSCTANCKHVCWVWDLWGILKVFKEFQGIPGDFRSFQNCF